MVGENDASERATEALAGLQRADGSWEGEVVWCPVITAQVVILGAITRREVSAERRRLLLRQFAVTRRPDGGWGLHPESNSYRFVTTLVYVAARLLGETPDHPMLAGARAFLDREPGGVFSLPQWGKVWLSFIGLYDPRGLNPCPPNCFCCRTGCRSRRCASTATPATSTLGSPSLWAQASALISDL